MKSAEYVELPKGWRPNCFAVAEYVLLKSINQSQPTPQGFYDSRPIWGWLWQIGQGETFSHAIKD